MPSYFQWNAMRQTNSGSVERILLDWFVARVNATIFALGSPAIDDHTGTDGDLVGLSAHRFAQRVRQFRSDAGIPSEPAGVMKRRRNLHSARVRTRDEHRAQVFTRTNRLTSGISSAGGVSLPLTRKISGHEAWLSARPHAASIAAKPPMIEL